MKKPITTDIRLKEVNLSDNIYIFTFEPYISPMIESIREIGLIHPPILERVSPRPEYRIVSGFKRILSLSHLKKDLFEAQVYVTDTYPPKLDLFLLNLFDNLSIRDLNVIEKSIILNKLMYTFQVSEQEVTAKYLPLLDFGAHKKMLNMLLPLIRLEDNIRISLLEDFISPELANQLLIHTPQDRQAIFKLISALRLGKNQQKEFMRLITDISAIQNKSSAEIIQHELIQSILNETNLTVTQKANKIKDMLRKQRFPTLTSVEESFNHLKKELKLPPEIIFRAAPFFENENYSLEINFKNQTEFDTALTTLNKISMSKKLTRLETIFL